MIENNFSTIPFLATAFDYSFFDQIEWQAGIAIVSYGVKIGIRVNSREVLSRIFRFFPPYWKLAASNKVEHLLSVIVGNGENQASDLYRDNEKVNYFNDLESVLSNLESAIRSIISEHAVGKVFIHAGVVGWENRALVFPGRSHCGKSTLIRELVKMGAIYYSDEFAVLDKKGLVHPYPKYISIREKWLPGSQIDYPIEAFGGVQGKKPLKPKKFIFAIYGEDSSFKIEELTRGNGILELLKHTCCTHQNPAQTLNFFEKATEDAKFFQAKRCEADQFAQIVLDQF